MVSPDQARQTPEHQREDGLIRCTGRQVQTNLLFEFHHPDDEGDHQQTQRPARLVVMKRVSTPSGPASTRAIMRSTRSQLPAPS